MPTIERTGRILVRLSLTNVLIVEQRRAENTKFDSCPRRQPPIVMCCNQ